MRGHVRRRGQKWAVVVDIGRDEHGGRKQKWFSGYCTRRDAEAALTEIANRLQTNTYVAPTKATTAEFLAEWIESTRTTIRPSTWASYKMNVERHIIPATGAIPLQKLSAGAHQQAVCRPARPRACGRQGRTLRPEREVHRHDPQACTE